MSDPLVYGVIASSGDRVIVCGQQARLLEQIGPGEGVEIRKRKSKRTCAQNKRYWALVTIGAISLWEDPSLKDDLHEEIAHLLLGLPPCEKTGMRRRRHTPKLNTKEFADYTDRVAMKLVELGADLSAWDDETRRVEEAA